MGLVPDWHENCEFYTKLAFTVLSRYALFLMVVIPGVIALGFGTSTRPPAEEFNVLVIDAGHGGKDPGCHGLVAKEKNITLSIALEVDSLLKKEFKDLKVILTRKTDVFVELHERARISSKNKADFFISIHCNANNNKTIYGSETYAMGLHKEDENMSIMVAENSVILLEENYEEQYEGFDPSSPDSYIMFTLLQNAYLKQSLNLARKIESEFKKTDRTSRGVKQAGFLVLWKAGTPALLVETGFLSNKIEEKYLHSEKGQKSIAQAIVRAIKIYAIELQS